MNSGDSFIKMDAGFGKWMRHVSISNTAGAGAAASLLVVLYFSLIRPLDVPGTLLFWGAVAIAGLFHGTFFGYFQYRVLPQHQLRISLFEWMTATVAATVAGWFLIILPFVFVANRDLGYAKPGIVQNFSVDYFISIAAAAGLCFGTVLGSAQFFLLRRRCERAALWIAANAFGWAAGMPLIYLTATLGDLYTPKFIVVVLCSFGGELSGNIVSLFTFFALEKMKIRSLYIPDEFTGNSGKANHTLPERGEIFLMRAKKLLLLFFTLICLSLSVKASVCACCAEPGQYSISVRKPAASELEILRDLRFSTANLYTNAAYPDNIRGISPLGEDYSITGLFQNRAWKLNFKDEKNQSGMLDLPLSATMVEFMADIFDRENDREPVLYKEWRFKFRVRQGGGIFLGGLRASPAAEYFLVLQGRGNNCTSAADFSKWRLEISGKKVGYAFYGNLRPAN